MAVAFVRTHTGFSEKVLGTSTSLTISTDTTPGNVLVARILFDNAGTASKPTIANAASIAKAAGEVNDWVFLGAARSTSTSIGAFASGEMWAIKTTVAWPVASYAVTLDTSVTMKATRVQEFSDALATLRSTVGTAYSTTTTAASAATTGTTPVVGDVAVGFIFGSNVAVVQAGDNDTTAGSWSSIMGVGSTGGNVATNNFGALQYKILTAATHQTLNNSAAMTAGNGAIVAILQRDTAQPLTGTVAGTSASTGTIGVVTRADTLIDTFDTQIDSKWVRVGTTGWSGGVVSATELALDYSGLYSANLYTLMDSWFFAKVTPPTTMALSSATGIGAADAADENALYSLILWNGTKRTLLLRHRQAGVNEDTTIDYDPVAMAYLDVEIIDGNALWQTSPNGVDWTVRRNRFTSLNLNEVQLWLYAGQTAVESTKGTAYFDNVNGAPAAVAHPLAGTAAAISATTGTIGQIVAGPGDDTYSDIYGDFYGIAGGQAHPLSGTVAAVSATTGNLAALHPLAGVAAATSTTSGVISAVHPLAGVATAVSTTVGSPAATHPLTGTTTAVSDATGTIGSISGATGGTWVDSVTTWVDLAWDWTGAEALPGGGVDHPLSGTTAATSATTATLQAQHPLAGVAAATSTTSGNPAAVHPLAGVATAVSASSGTINLVGGAQSYPLAGTTAATSATTGTIRAKFALAGVVAGTTTTTGNPTARHPLAGVTVAVTTTSGSISWVGAVATGRPKAWTGSTWAKKPGKVWTGSAWVEKPVKKWDGSQWKALV